MRALNDTVAWFRGHRSARVPFILAFVAILGVLLTAPRSPAIKQPIAFNHRRHTKDLGLGCEFCHQYVTTGTHAGLPDAQVCGACHQVQQGESAEAARLTALLGRGEPLRFNKLFRLPAHAYFSHRRHVGIAQLECRACHGAIAETERPPSRPLVTVRMKFCLDCHKARQQSRDCVACHR